VPLRYGVGFFIRPVSSLLVWSSLILSLSLCQDSGEYKYALLLVLKIPPFVFITVDSAHTQITMSSSSASFGLLEALKSSLLQPWPRVKDHGILSIGVILGLIVFYLARYLSSPFRKLPPGPRGYPIIGNISDMKTGLWLKFAQWHKKYGQFVISDPFLAQFRCSHDQVMSSTSM
jgi:hypothetical protein